MFAAIATIISAVLAFAGGIFGGIAKSESESLAQQQARVDYYHAQDLGYFGLIDEEKKTLLIILGGGFLLLVVIMLMSKKK